MLGRQSLRWRPGARTAAWPMPASRSSAALGSDVMGTLRATGPTVATATSQALPPGGADRDGLQDDDHGGWRLRPVDADAAAAALAADLDVARRPDHGGQELRRRAAPPPRGGVHAGCRGRRARPERRRDVAAPAGAASVRADGRADRLHRHPPRGHRGVEGRRWPVAAAAVATAASVAVAAAPAEPPPSPSPLSPPLPPVAPPMAHPLGGLQRRHHRGRRPHRRQPRGALDFVGCGLAVAAGVGTLAAVVFVVVSIRVLRRRHRMQRAARARRAYEKATGSGRWAAAGARRARRAAAECGSAAAASGARRARASGLRRRRARRRGGRVRSSSSVRAPPSSARVLAARRRCDRRWRRRRRRALRAHRWGRGGRGGGGGGGALPTGGSGSRGLDAAALPLPTRLPSVTAAAPAPAAAATLARIRMPGLRRFGVRARAAHGRHDPRRRGGAGAGGARATSASAASRAGRRGATSARAARAPPAARAPARRRRRRREPAAAAEGEGDDGSRRESMTSQRRWLSTLTAALSDLAALQPLGLGALEPLGLAALERRRRRVLRGDTARRGGAAAGVTGRRARDPGDPRRVEDLNVLASRVGCV